MSKFIIQGGKTLSGTIRVNGAKNAALKLVAASLLSEDQMTITRVPGIVELQWLQNIIKSIGGSVYHFPEKQTMILHTPKIINTNLPPEWVHKTRSSVLLVGSLLARVGHVRFPHPGGCALGQRPIDFFLDGFKKMGAVVEEMDTYYDIHAENGLVGCTYFFPRISHTATESLMMTATLAKGVTILQNAACEPEIVALAEYLNAHGANISGAGTHTITITGVDRLGAGVVETIPDRLETGTFAILGALCASELKITDCNPEHVQFLWNFFDKMGVDYSYSNNEVIVRGKGIYKGFSVQTHEYPGFATDVQPPFTVLLTQCEGISMVHETIFDGRLFYTDLLNQMGAHCIMCDPHRVIVNGPTKLFGRKISSPDIRAGMALVIAALIAEGESNIDNIYQIDRGYADLVWRLKAIGADITRSDDIVKHA